MSKESDELHFAQEILMIRRKTCINCWHSRSGGCSLSSCDCATAVMRQATNPPRWTSYADGEEQEAKILGVNRKS